MAKSVLTTSDLKKLPKDVQIALKEYVFDERVDENQAISLEDSSNAVSKDPLKILDGMFFPVETISLEASIAFLFGLDPLSSIPCIEYLTIHGFASKEKLANLAGKKDSKGINGLIGSINRRFKSLFSHNDANQNLIYYRKKDKTYAIDESFQPALNFGMWAIKQDVDWEACKEISWSADYEPLEHIRSFSDGRDILKPVNPMPGELDLNIDSIRGFISKTKLGDSVYAGSHESDGDYRWGVCRRALSNESHCNFLLFSDIGCYWYVDESPIRSLDELPVDPFLSEFFNQSPNFEKLGRLVSFYRENKFSDRDEASNYAIANVDLEADFGKFGFFSYGDAPAGIGGGAGVFLWFANEKEALDHIEQVLPFDPPGPHDMSPELVASEVQKINEKRLNSAGEDEYEMQELISDLNKVLRQFSQIEWMGQFEELVSGEVKTDFEKQVRETFLIISIRTLMKVQLRASMLMYSKIH